MPLNELDALAKKYNTDKGSSSARGLSPKFYVVAYYSYLEPVRNDPISVFEIGVQQGGSLKMWEEYLPNAKIFAIDIQEKCKKFETNRTKIFIGDQTDCNFLKAIAEAHGPFDCIVDDGGHTMEQHQASLHVLWPFLKEGGWYAIEDLHTCYMENFGGGFKDQGNTVERVLKPVMDSMNYKKAPPPYVPNISAMHVYPSVTFLFKGVAKAAEKQLVGVQS